MVHRHATAVPSDVARSAVARVQVAVREFPSGLVVRAENPEAVERIANQHVAAGLIRQARARAVIVVLASPLRVPAAQILHFVRDRVTPAFTALMAYQVERARGFYARALAALPAVDRRAQRPGLIMAAIYQALLREIERDEFRVLGRRIALTPLAKAWIAWRTSWSY